MRGVLAMLIAIGGLSSLGLMPPLVEAAGGAKGCKQIRACPAEDGSYAWQPLPGAGLQLTCYSDLATRVPAAFSQMVDYRGEGYLCRLPEPKDAHRHGWVDFFGPQTVAAGSVPLRQDELRLTIDVGARRTDILRVDWGDGTHWQRTVGTSRTFDLAHSYARERTYYLLVSLRDKLGYLGIEGVGPFQRPAPGPRARRCGYEAWGKGWTLSASEALTCAEAQHLFSVYRRGGKLTGYRCRSSGLPPYGSDVFVETCINGSRVFVLTSNP